MKNCSWLYILLTSLISVSTSAQQTLYYDLGFRRYDSIVVKDVNNQTLAFPWVGGLNSSQFGQVDLNMDGIKDLVVFEKHTNRFFTFINNGVPNLVSYRYAPEYSLKLPQIESWMILVDYNNDGKEDIFAYAGGAIKVFKNVSTTTNGLTFVLEAPVLFYKTNGGVNSNIFVLPDDYPAIIDIDNDGDIDILTFNILGSIVGYYKNVSIEKYGHPNKLEFQIEDECWGKFMESNSSPQIIMGITCNMKTENAPNAKPGNRHAGSTLMAIDINNDGDKDLIIGDVDYQRLQLLINGGTPTNAVITQVDTLFPLYTMPVNIISFPASFYLDVNNDNKKDFISSPFESTIFKAENFKNVAYYKNTGTTNSPVLSYMMDNFITGDMIDVGTAAYPVFFDYNGDGLLDLFIGNYGYRDSSWWIGVDMHSRFVSSIALFKNIGTTVNPEFKLITRDFGNLKQYGLAELYPAIGDIDDDGDFDLICGEENGKLHLFTNISGNPTTYNFVHTSTNFQGIDVGYNSTPVLIDLDKDSLLDLVIGERLQIYEDSFGMMLSRKGNLNFYKNTGSKSNPVFTFVTDSMGGVDVTDDYINYYRGFSVASFFKDNSGNYRLIAGGATGLLFYYKDIEQNITGHFTLDSTMSYKYSDDTLYSNVFYMQNGKPEFIRTGFRSAPAVADINNDGWPDLVVGNAAGGLEFYLGTVPPPRPTDAIHSLSNSNLKFDIYPNPASDAIWINCDIPLPSTGLQVTVFNIQGQVVKQFSGLKTKRFAISVSELNPGLYYCRLSAGNICSSKGFIKVEE